MQEYENDPKIRISPKLFLLSGISVLLLLITIYFHFQNISDIRSAVAEIESPQRKLSAANNLLIALNHSNDAFRASILNLKENNLPGLDITNEVLDSAASRLNEQLSADAFQSAIGDSIVLLLESRKTLHKNYVRFRKGLNNSNETKENLTNLDEIIRKNEAQIDSMVISDVVEKTEETIDTLIAQEQKKNFWEKIFGSKKNEQKLEKVTRQNTASVTDTLLITKKNYDAEEASAIIQGLIENQSKRRSQFIQSEYRVFSLDKKFHDKIEELLYTVQEDISAKHAAATQIGDLAITRAATMNTILLIIFALLSTVLLALILTDIFKANAYKKQLEKAKIDAEFYSEQRKRFLANMSHEIRTPLQSIIGYAEMLNERPDEKEQAVQAIHRSARHLHSIVDDILDFQKTEKEILKLVFTEVDLHHELTVLSKELLPGALKKQNELQFHISALEGNRFMLDEKRIRQLIYNIIGNSIKFTSNGKIELLVTVSDNQLNLLFSDTGKGISSQYLPFIFEEFTQDQQVTDGTGLGMAIVKKIVDAWKGELYIDSAPDEGTRIRVSLPITQPHVKSNEKLASNPLTPLWPNEVCIIDDSEAITTYCAALLKQKEISVSVFNHPSQVLACSTLHRFEVFLIDIRMPEMDGIELMRKLKPNISPYAICIAMTAETQPDQLQAIRSTGFQNVLTKPFQSQALYAHVNINASQRFYFHLHQTGLVDTALAEELKSIFLHETAEDIEVLKGAMQAENLDERNISFAAHRLAGRLSQYGFTLLAEKCRQLEHTTEAAKMLKGINEITPTLDEYISSLSHTSAS